MKVLIIILVTIAYALTLFILGTPKDVLVTTVVAWFMGLCVGTYFISKTT